MHYLLDANRIAWYLRGRQEFVRAVDERRAVGVAMSIHILGIDERIARTWGEEDARLSQAGTPIGDLDLFVAATALSHGLVVCTQNRKHFERVKGVKIESVELARKR